MSCAPQLAGSRELTFDTFLITDRPALQAPGPPVLFATANGIHLETPSEMTKAVVKEAEDKVMSQPEHEQRSDARAGGGCCACANSRLFVSAEAAPC